MKKTKRIKSFEVGVENQFGQNYYQQMSKNG